MESLYRKYRPQTFADVVGQSHVVSTLERAVTEGRTSHAYLFCGPRGTGKTTMARILAKALMCEQGAGQLPDGSCEQCRLIAAGEHPDVYELDAASRTGVDNVREEIISRVDYAPVRGRAKVYIIDEVHMLTAAAFNALLKTLEEPPAHVVFILCTTDPQKVLPTILSRVQRFDFRPIAAADMRAHLAEICEREGFSYEGDALDLVVRHARGGMRDAISTLEQLSVFGDGAITAAAARDLLGEVADARVASVSQALARCDMPAVFAEVAALANGGRDLLQFARELLAHVRDAYVAGVAGAAPGVLDATPDEQAELAAEADAYGSPERLVRVLGVLDEAALRMRTATNQRLELEVALTRAARPESELTLEALAERIATLESRLASGDGLAGAAAAAPASQPSARAAVPVSRAAAPDHKSVEASGQVAAPSQPAGGMRQPVAPLPRETASAPDVAAPAAASQPVASEVVAPVVPAVPAATGPVAPAEAVPAAPAEERPTIPAMSAPTAPVAPPKAVAPTPQPVPAAPVSNGQLQRTWKAMVDGLLKTNAACGSLLLSATAMADDGTTLTLALPSGSSFMRRMLERSDVKQVVEGAIGSAFGTRTLAFVEAGQSSPASRPASAPKVAPDSRSARGLGAASASQAATSPQAVRSSHTASSQAVSAPRVATASQVAPAPRPAPAPQSASASQVTPLSDVEPASKALPTSQQPSSEPERGSHAAAASGAVSPLQPAPTPRVTPTPQGSPAAQPAPASRGLPREADAIAFEGAPCDDDGPYGGDDPAYEEVPYDDADVYLPAEEELDAFGSGVAPSPGAAASTAPEPVASIPAAPSPTTSGPAAPDSAVPAPAASVPAVPTQVASSPAASTPAVPVPAAPNPAVPTPTASAPVIPRPVNRATVSAPELPDEAQDIVSMVSDIFGKTKVTLEHAR